MPLTPRQATPCHALPCTPCPATVLPGRPAEQNNNPTHSSRIGGQFSENPERNTHSHAPPSDPCDPSTPTRAPTAIHEPPNLPTASLRCRFPRLQRALSSLAGNSVPAARRCDLLPRAPGSTAGHPRVHSHPAELPSLPSAPPQTPRRRPSASLIGRHNRAPAQVRHYTSPILRHPSSSLSPLRVPWWHLAACRPSPRLANVVVTGEERRGTVGAICLSIFHTESMIVFVGMP